VFGFGNVCPTFALEISVAPGFMYYTWVEHLPGGDVKESGYLPTLSGSITGVPLKRDIPELRLNFDANSFYGKVDYDTRTQSGTPVSTDSSYWGFTLDGRAGWRMRALDQSYVEPFIGLAYDLWVRDIENTTFPTSMPPFIGTAQGYTELYQVLHGRIGIQSSVSLKVKSMFGIKTRKAVDSIIQFSFSLDPTLWAREQIDYPGVGRVVLQNGRRLGWTIEGGILWWHLEAKSYWWATRFDTSNQVSGLSQPKSDQDMVGFKIGYQF
jgi:hypothetical protein